MKTKLYGTALVLLLMMSCGGRKSTSESPSESTQAIEEEAIVDSISTSVDKIKTELSTETDETMEEIDSLLNDI